MTPTTRSFCRVNATCSVDGCDRRFYARTWCKLHYDRWRTSGNLHTKAKIPDEERFWSRVDKSGDCWLWTASLNDSGYGLFRSKGGNVRAHRWSYEHCVGPIPDGLDLDHLCRVRNCVNPAHLEPVTRAENVRRGRAGVAAAARHATITHCPAGHEYTPENTVLRPTVYGGVARGCITCRTEQKRARRAQGRLVTTGSEGSGHE